MAATYVYSRTGSLVVAQEAHDERSLQRALKQIHPDLVLQREVGYYHVVQRVSHDRPAIHVCYWEGPLSSGLLEKVQAQFKRGPDGAREVDEHNARLRERLKRERHEETTEAVRGVLPFMSDKRSGCLPRSQKLRQSRDRRRSLGEQV